MLAYLGQAILAFYIAGHSGAFKTPHIGGGGGGIRKRTHPIDIKLRDTLML